jgi:hypothetical protein
LEERDAAVEMTSHALTSTEAVPPLSAVKTLFIQPGVAPLELEKITSVSPVLAIPNHDTIPWELCRRTVESAVAAGDLEAAATYLSNTIRQSNGWSLENVTEARLALFYLYIVLGDVKKSESLLVALERSTGDGPSIIPTLQILQHLRSQDPTSYRFLECLRELTPFVNSLQRSILSWINTDMYLA